MSSHRYISLPFNYFISIFDGEMLAHLRIGYTKWFPSELDSFVILQECVAVGRTCSTRVLANTRRVLMWEHETPMCFFSYCPLFLYLIKSSLHHRQKFMTEYKLSKNKQSEDERTSALFFLPSLQGQAPATEAPRDPTWASSFHRGNSVWAFRYAESQGWNRYIMVSPHRQLILPRQNN